MEAGAARLVGRTFGAEAISRVGDAVSTVALPLTAVLALGASPAELALIGAAQALPILLLSIPVGAWVDRRTARWPILLAGDLARATFLLAVPVAAAAGMLTLPLLAVLAFAMSVAGTFFDLAFAGWLPRLLKGDDLHRVNARVELARSTAVFRLVIFGAIPVGTVIGGVVGQAFGLRAALTLSALGLFAGAAPYLLVRVARLRRVEELATAIP